MGDKKRLPDVGISWLTYSAAVCCAVSGCDHLDCHGGPFRVIFVATDGVYLDQVKGCVYSSETGAWSTPVTLGNDCEIYVQHKQDVLSTVAYIEDTTRPMSIPGEVQLSVYEIYFTISEANAIFKYNMHMNILSMINLPSKDDSNIALMEIEDSSLGFVYIRDSSLYLWSRKLNSGGDAEWVQCKVVELGKRIPVANYHGRTFVVGAAEDVVVIFVSTDTGLFTIKINSAQVKKIGEPRHYFSIIPFMSFYTPDSGKIIARKAKDSLVSDVPFN